MADDPWAAFPIAHGSVPPVEPTPTAPQGPAGSGSAAVGAIQTEGQPATPIPPPTDTDRMGGGNPVSPASSDPWSAFPVAGITQNSGPQSGITPTTHAGADIVRGTGRGLVEGAGSILGMPADLWHMLDRGYQWAITKGAEKMGYLTPEQGAALRAPIGDSETSPISSERINNHLLGLAKSAGADTSAPTTTAGQAAETVASFLPGAAAFGASSAKEVPAALMKYGVLPAATSEAAGQATKGTDAEPYARMAAAVLPAAIGAGASAVGRLANPTAKALEGVTTQQMTEAQRILDNSRAAGAPVTSAEAIQQATGSATRASDIQRVVEQSPEGAAIMRPFFAQRPGQTQALGQNMLDQIAPAPTAPYSVAPRVQAAAEGVVNDADRARSAAVKPLYQSASKDTVPVSQVETFLQGIDGLIADDKTGLISPKLAQLRDSLIETPDTPARPAQRVATTTPTGANIYRTIPAQPATPRVPVTDIENLDNARKFFRDEIAQPAIAQDAVPKQVGAKMGSLLSDLDDMMEQSSADFLAGKQKYQDITRNTVEPLQQSPTGQLAVAPPGFEKQAAILFNSNPLPGSDAAIATAVRNVSARDPEAAQQMVRMFMEKTFNEATQNNVPGGNQWGGPKFAAVIAGNPQQARNLQAAITALPNGTTRWAAFQKAQDILEAMGRRQPAGSQTEFNRQIAKSLEGTGAIGDIAATAASPNKWLGVASDIYKRYAFGQNTKQLAQAMVSGDVKDLSRIVGSGANSTRSQAALIALLAKEGYQSGSRQPSRDERP